MSELPKPGDVIGARYPFVRDTFSFFDVDGLTETKTWRPGVWFEDVGTGEDTVACAHAEGEIIFTVIDVHKPGKYATRVFLTRQFRSPDGNLFGKPKLHIWTLEKFRRLARGYRYHYWIGDEQRSPA